MSMMSTLNTGVSALNAFSTAIDVIGDNITNSSTYGFKQSRAEYSDNFSDYLKRPVGSSNSGNSQISSQIGSGVSISQISTQFDQGDFDYTGFQNDLAIDGDGFFIVSNPTETGSNYYTRAGNFRQDSDGYIVNPDGLRLQYVQGEGGVSDITGTLSSLKIGSSYTLGANQTVGSNTYSSGGLFTIESYSFDNSGQVSLNLYSDSAALVDGTTVEASFDLVIGQLALANFSDNQGLIRVGGNLYQASAASGDATQIEPGTGSNTGIIWGALEMSNVDLTSEMTNLIMAQRSFQAGSRIVTTSDEVMQEVVNLKR